MTKRLLIAKKLFFYSVLAGVAAVLGQNCSNGFTPIMYFDHLSSNSGSSVEFAAAKTVIRENCVSCHSAGGKQFDTRLDLTSEQQFILAGFVIPGQPDQSKLIQRLKNFEGVSATKDMPEDDSLSDSEYQTLRRWILAMGATTQPDANPYVCNANETLENKLIPSRLLLLSNLQYTNTIKDFLAISLPSKATEIYDKAVAPITIPANSSAKFPRSIYDLSKEKLRAFFDISDALSTELTNTTNVDTFIAKMISLNPGACLAPNLGMLSADCVAQLIRNLGLRLYRRPLAEEINNNEVELFRDEFTRTADKAEAVSNLIMRMMMSQNFLFQMEDREIQNPTNPKLLQLSSYSIVNRLSFTFWNTMPDEYLLSFAAANNLQDNLKFNEALNYVLSSAKLDSSLREFAFGYLLLNKTPVFNPQTASLQFFNDGVPFDSAMTKAMNEEVQDLVSYVTRSNGKFADLFTTDISVTRHPPLMQVYGVSEAPPVITEQNAVRMPAGTRAGILTRAALLSEGSGSQHLIHRAVRIKRDLLCMPQNPAPADTTPPVQLTDQQYETYTTRQRFEQNTGSGTCYTCHQTINPWGAALSKYNGLGFYKPTEPAFTKSGTLTGAQLPLDPTTNLTGIVAGGGPINDAIEFSSFVSTRPEAQACFTKNYAYFVLGREPDVEKEGCRLNKMYSTIKSGTLKDTISTIATDLEFRHRKLD